MAFEADNLALERAYLDRQQAPGSLVKVSLEGAIAPRPKMEGRGTEPHLIVHRFFELHEGEPCPAVSENTSLWDTRWKLMRLKDSTVFVDDESRRPELRLGAEDNSVAGYAGCNRFNGGFIRNRNQLRFGLITATMMACAQGMDLETLVYKSLNAVRTWRITGRILDLFDEHETLIMRYEADPAS